MDIAKLIVSKTTESFVANLNGVIAYISNAQHGTRNDTEVLESVKNRLRGIVEGLNMAAANDAVVAAVNTHANED